MIGKSLRELHNYINNLKSSQGSYYIHCSKITNQPFPVYGKKFETREKARKAAKTAEKYRQLVRYYNPDVPFYKLSISEEDEKIEDQKLFTLLSNPDFNSSVNYNFTELNEFYFEIISSILEILSDCDKKIQKDIINQYLIEIESIEKKGIHSIILLENIASKIYDKLSIKKKNKVLRKAAEILYQPTINLKPDENISFGNPYKHPLYITLRRLSSTGIIDNYTICPSRKMDSDDFSWKITLKGYKYDQNTLVVLLITVDLLRQYPDLSFDIHQKDRIKKDEFQFYVKISLKEKLKPQVSIDSIFV